MTYDEFKQEIKTVGLTVSEAEFPKAKTKNIEVKPPFICYLKEADKSIWAGGKPVYTNVRLSIELYTDKSDTESKSKLVTWLKSHNILFDEMDCVWISSEKFYMTLFMVTLL